MIVEAVTVSVNYSDYLSKCISNKEKLDRWIVVTEKQDTKCINLCKSNNIEFVLCEDFYTNDAIFAKGRGVDFGLSFLNKKNWLLNIDSDICLPDDFRNVVKNLLHPAGMKMLTKYVIEEKKTQSITARQIFLQGT